MISPQCLVSLKDYGKVETKNNLESNLMFYCLCIGQQGRQHPKRGNGDLHFPLKAPSQVMKAVPCKTRATTVSLHCQSQEEISGSVTTLKTGNCLKARKHL